MNKKDFIELCKKIDNVRGLTVGHLGRYLKIIRGV